MPFQAIAWAFGVETNDPLEKCVLAWLANKADVEGLVSNFDIRDVAWFAGCAGWEVDGAIDRLAAQRLLCRTDMESCIFMFFPLVQSDELGRTWPNREPLPAEVRRLVAEGAECAACGAEKDIEADHIFPRALGGSNALQNLQPLCSTCNRAKSARTGWVPIVVPVHG
jgi:hypothetical protein